MENFILFCIKKKDFSESEIGNQQLDIRALKKSENRKPGATSLFHSNLDLNANKVAKPAIIAQRLKLQGFAMTIFRYYRLRYSAINQRSKAQNPSTTSIKIVRFFTMNG